MKYAVLPCALILAPALFISASYAQRAPQESQHIRYADLDLTSTAGQRKFDQRIALAKQALCGSPSAIALADSNQARRCLRDLTPITDAARQRIIARAAE